MGIDFMQRRWLTYAMGAAALLILVSGLLLRSRSPQLPHDAAVFKTVDALFTALTSRNRTELAACRQRLEELHRSGRLPSPPAEHLTALIHQGERGEWDQAAQQLYDFMLSQRGRSL